MKQLLFLLLLTTNFAFGQDWHNSTASRPDTSDWVYQRSKIKDETFFISIEPSAQHYFNRGQLRSKMQDYQGAIADLSRCVELAPENPGGYYARGGAKELQGDYAGAAADFTQVVRLQPGFEWGWNDRAQTYIMLNKLAEAEADLLKALELHPNWANPFFNLGRVYEKRNNPEKAIAYYVESIRVDHTNPMSYNNMGYMYSSLKKYDQAIQCFTQAIQLFPQYINALINRAEARMNSGDRTGACQDLKAAADLGNVRAFKLFNELCAKN